MCYLLSGITTCFYNEIPLQLNIIFSHFHCYFNFSFLPTPPSTGIFEVLNANYTHGGSPIIGNKYFYCGDTSGCGEINITTIGSRANQNSSTFSVKYAIASIIQLSIVPACVHTSTFFRPYLWEVRNTATLLGAFEGLIVTIFSLLLNFSC